MTKFEFHHRVVLHGFTAITASYYRGHRTSTYVKNCAYQVSNEIYWRNIVPSDIYKEGNNFLYLRFSMLKHIKEDEIEFESSYMSYIKISNKWGIKLNFVRCRKWIIMVFKKKCKLWITRKTSVNMEFILQNVVKLIIKKTKEDQRTKSYLRWHILIIIDTSNLSFMKQIQTW